MDVRLSDTLLPMGLATAGVVSLVLWLRLAPEVAIEARIPGLDRPSVERASQPAETPRAVAGEPQAGAGKPAAATGDWPGFRGANRDGISTDLTPLARSWPATGPPVLWSLEVGEGYAGAAIGRGCVYLLDYDEEAAADTLRCLSLDDGREIWRNSYAVPLARNHGISRTVPALAGDYVLTLGPRCHLAAWDAATGRCHWLRDLVEDFNATVPRWYAGQCPLVDQDRLIVAPGGKSLVVALDYRTGQPVWESANPRGWTMTHSSVVPMELAGRRMYVYCGSGGVAGVAAEDGTLLWDSTEWPEQFATATSPVVLPEGRLFLSSGYGNSIGSLVLQIAADGDKFLSTVLWRLPPARFNAEQHTPIFRAGHLFGVRKRGGGQLVCLDLQGNEVWNSGGDRFGHGPYLFADNVVLALSNDGELTMAEASPQGYQRLARHAAIPDGREAWGPMAIVEGRLVVRDASRMVCLDLRAQQP